MRTYNGHRGMFLALVAAIAFTSPASAATITQWDFNAIGIQPAPYNNPAPTTGSGTAVALGMTNSYNGGNTNNDDVVSTPGTANPSFVENAWQIRGTANNGWAASAPQYSQGIEIDASTVGFHNIQFAFDWYSTGRGSATCSSSTTLTSPTPAAGRTSPAPARPEPTLPSPRIGTTHRAPTHR